MYNKTTIIIILSFVKNMWRLHGPLTRYNIYALCLSPATTLAAPVAASSTIVAISHAESISLAIALADAVAVEVRVTM